MKIPFTAIFLRVKLVVPSVNQERIYLLICESLRLSKSVNTKDSIFDKRVYGLTILGLFLCNFHSIEELTE